MTDTKKIWTDPQGRSVPDHLVTDAERMKDELAERLVAGAEALRLAEVSFKEQAFSEMYAAKALLFEQWGAKIGGPRGGFSVRTYDGSAEVEISVQDRIAFSSELQVAKALIDECISGWSEGANENLKLLVDDIFSVNQAGKIDTRRVLGLRKYKIKDDLGHIDQRWERAMDAVSAAMITDQTATYIRFYRRNQETNSLDQVALDFSKL